MVLKWYKFGLILNLTGCLLHAFTGNIGWAISCGIAALLCMWGIKDETKQRNNKK